MKTYLVKSTSDTSFFEVETNNFRRAIEYYDAHNKSGCTAVIVDGETGEILFEGHDGMTSYIERNTMLGMIDLIGEKYSSAGSLLFLLGLLVGALD